MPDLSSISDEQIIDQIQKSKQAIDDLVAAQTELKKELIERLKEQNRKGKIVGNYGLTFVSFPDFRSVKVETAKELACTKTVVQSDSTKLKKLYEAGVEIDGVKMVEQLRISEIEKE